MSDIESIKVAEAPAPKGPYSQVIRAGDFLFVSGQGPVDSKTGEFVFGTIQEETRLTFDNVISILNGCGASASNIVKCAVFLADENDFAAMNEIYAAYFPGAAPARTTVAVRMVKQEMKIEIDCIAYLPQAK